MNAMLVHSAMPHLLQLGVNGGVLWMFFFKGREAVPIFVLGSQRSGTTMIADLLAKSPDCNVYLGNKRPLVFEGSSRLIALDRLRKLLTRSYTRTAVFKPNNDLQYARDFLNFHPAARLLWIYRDYRDAVNSSLRRWGGAHRDIILGIAQGRQLHPGQQAIAEGITPALHDLLQGLCSDGLSEPDGAALLWYVRNALYFDLGLPEQERVMLLSYEALVSEPDVHGRRVFDFIGVRFNPAYVEDVYASSVCRYESPVLRPEIAVLCAEMMRRLDACHRQSGQVSHPTLSADLS